MILLSKGKFLLCNVTSIHDGTLTYYGDLSNL